MEPVPHSERSATRFKPRFPRLRRLLQRREVEEKNWTTVPDEDGMVRIKPTHKSSPT